jgi:hypothetical protein
VFGLAELAVDFKTGVSFRKTSFNAALLYAVVPCVLPSFDAEANPSISPSEIKSSNVAKLLLCKLSGVRVGCGGGGGLPPPEPIIFFGVFVMLVPVEYQLLHLLQLNQ